MSARLIELKRKIELMGEAHQREVLRIIREKDYVVLTENQNGTFTNITLLREPELVALENYVQYVDQQQKRLNDGETDRRKIHETFFNTDKECSLEETA